MTTDKKLKLTLGKVYITQAAHHALHPQDVFVSLSRHSCGDWGECGVEDWNTNQEALIQGGRILSVYRARNGKKFWIITEANSQSTTVLLPEDY